MMQNLEMKKEAHLSKKLKEEKEKEMAVMKEELDSIKEQLRLKDQQLELSKTQIHKQSKELQNLKQVKQFYPQEGQRGNTHSEDPETRTSNQNFIKLSFRKSTEKSEPGTMKIEHQPSGELKRASTPYDTPLNPSLVSNPQCKEKNKTILGVTTKRIKPQKKEIHEKGECSFVSVSSVSMNINEISNSDIEVMDSCVNALNKRKQNASSPYVFRRPQSKTTHVKMESKPLPETNYEKCFGLQTPLTKKSDIALKSYTLKPNTGLKKNVVGTGKIPIYPLVESIKFNKEEKKCLSTVEKKAPINSKNNCFKEIKVVLHSGEKAQLFKERSESVQEKLPLSNSGRKPEYKSETKGFFSNVSANYGSALNQLAGNGSAKSHLLDAFKPSMQKNIERNPGIKMPRSLSLHEAKSNVSQVKHRKNMNNRNPRVECFENSQYQFHTPETKKLTRTDYLNSKSPVAKRKLAIPTVSIPTDILNSEDVVSKLTEEELLRAASNIKQNTNKKTKLNQEIEDLIQQQKESLKEDFRKAKETEQCFKLTPNVKPSAPALFPGDIDEAVDCDFS